MAKRRAFDLMIDSAMFGETLSDFVKRNLSTLGGYTLGELAHLWAIAKRQANAILKA